MASHMLISDTYRQLNIELYDRNPNYGTSGELRAQPVDRMARALGVKTVLDYGCGRGTLKTKLEEAGELPYAILEYDPAIPGKETKPIRADFVVCSDVLEHIEPECLDAVLDDIRNIARVGILLVVSMVEAMKTLADGRNAHLIVESIGWWTPKLAQRWRIDNLNEFKAGFIFLGGSK